MVVPEAKKDNAILIVERTMVLDEHEAGALGHANR